jgi:uncharacterized protein (DUF885 family)
MRTRFPVVLFAAALVVSCGRTTTPPAQTAPSFDEWSERLAQDWLRIAPQSATRAQYFSGAEQDALERQLSLVGEWGNTFGQAAARQRADIASRALGELAALPRDGMTPTQRTSAALLQWSLEDARDFAGFAQQSYVFDQFNGLQLDLINHLTQNHPIRNRRDVENYLARLGQVAPTIDKGIEEARGATAAGIIPPRFIVERVIAQIDGFLADAPAANPFVATLATRMEALGEALPLPERGTFRAEAERELVSTVIPAYRRVRDLLNEQLPKATDDAGVWRLPRGAEWYAFSLRRFTTTNLTADEIHNIGLREVARIEGEMDTILRQLGYANGTVNERYAQLDLAIQPKGPGDPRAQILADAERQVRDAERRAALIFDLRPKAPVEVRREPAFSEKTAAAHYTDPAPDGSRPGIYYLPLPGPTYGLLRMRSLAYHEAVPGHHFQIALQQEQTDLPRYRRLLIFGAGSAFVEGWALYAERLADENNWYEGDPQGRLGYLNSMLFRARRLVVDTGIHAKRWTRQQAIDYGINAQEIERYIVWPGQATSYMIGQLRIVELREKARAALGDRFDIKQFHNLVLRTGDVPLEVLGQQVDGWIADVGGRQ